ncbi:MAG: tetratricopeptide repeat protein [Acidobacteriota bacterium]|nr:tetratricopeptide repeat protein [Acidobacteriota bacterium]
MKIKIHIPIVIIILLSFPLVGNNSLFASIFAQKTQVSEHGLLKEEENVENQEKKGLQAEMAGQWEEAIRIYKSILLKDSKRGDLWLRISDIEASLGRPKAAAEALQHAVELSADDASLYSKLAHAYSVADEKELALEAINRAVELAPSNLEYLYEQASIANWCLKYKIAEASFKKILSINPGDNNAELGLARVTAWGGHLDKAVELYKKYVKKNPQNKIALMEYIRVEAWRGNYACALKKLEEHRHEIENPDDYLMEKGRILAWAMRPKAALSIVLPLLEKHPDDYELNISRTLALAGGHYAKEAVSSLNTLTRLEQNNPQTELVRRFVMTPFRSNIIPGFSYYTDSSNLTIYHGSIDGNILSFPPSKLQAGIETHRLSARPGSGLEQINGDKYAWHNHLWLGLSHRITPQVNLYANFGTASVEAEKEILTYRMEADFQLRDQLKLSFKRDHGFFIVSPRTVGLAIKRTLNQAQLQWEPGIQYHIDTSFSYNDLSDTNSYWEFIFSPRRIAARTENFNLDIGLGAWLFGYKYNFNNGYYDPKFYQRYVATSFGYWKISDDDGVSMIFTAGIQKDNYMERFRFSGTAEVEGVFGLYKDLMLKLRGGVFELRLESGAFRAYIFQISLTGRF